MCYQSTRIQLYADVAELVDALASGASVPRDVEVQVLSSVPRRSYTNPHPVGSAWERSQTTMCAHPLGWAFFVVRPARWRGRLGLVGGCRLRRSSD